jgi:hypothetical protein
MSPENMEHERMKLENKYGPGYAMVLKTSKAWYVRVWNLITNPIAYLFLGEVRW